MPLSTSSPPWRERMAAAVRRLAEHPTTRRWGPWLGWTAGAFVVGYLFAALVLFPPRPRREVVTTPDLRGLPEAVARRRALAAGLEYVRERLLPHPSVRAGVVLAHTPQPGEEVPPGTPVRSLVSAGPQPETIPDVRRLPQVRAWSLLDRLGFRVRFVGAHDPLTPFGRVLDVRPTPGTRLPMGRTVELVVSLGPRVVAVPNVVGLPLDSARARLGDLGLATVVERVVDPARAGLVVGQRPPPGASVSEGRGVTLVVGTAASASIPADSPALPPTAPTDTTPATPTHPPTIPPSHR